MKFKAIGSLLSGASKAVDSIGNAFDKNFTSKEEILAAKASVIQNLTEITRYTEGIKREVVLAEVSGNKLQRSWRPILMLAFGLVVTYSFFIQPAFFPEAVKVSNDLPTDFWDLLKLGVGGYVGGRSLEKVTTVVSDAWKDKK